MPFQLSPGVNVSEIDLTTVVPAVATTDAAIGGVFKWGPVDKATLVVSEDELAREYGKPDNDNYETWMTAANFLAYSNRLYVSRAFHSTGTDVKLSGSIVGSTSYFIVDNNTTTGVTTTDDAIADTTASMFEGISDVISVDTSDINVAIPDSDFDDANNVINYALSTVLVEGESVQLTSSNTLPTGLNELQDYFIVNKTETSFQLSTTRFGAAEAFSDIGDGTHTLTRSGDTRIELSKTAFANSTTTVEFFNEGRSFNAIANTSSLGTNGLLSQHVIENEDRYDAAALNFDAAVRYIAKYPGALGNSLKVSVCDSAAAYESEILAAYNGAYEFTYDQEVGSNTGLFVTTDGDAAKLTAVTDQLTVGDLLRFGNTSIGYQYNEITTIGAVSINGANAQLTIEFSDPLSISDDVDLSSNDNPSTGLYFYRYWQYYQLVQQAPGTSNYVANFGNTAAQDELHVVVVDEDGKISGSPKQVLEVWSGLSRASNAKDVDGGALWYKEVLNTNSRYVYVGQDDVDAPSAIAVNVNTSTNILPTTLSFAYGSDIGNESTSVIGDTLRAYDIFKNSEVYDVSLILTGKTRGGANGTQLANYIVDNLCEVRKDCVSFVSPQKNDTVDNFGDITEDLVQFRNSLRGTSYSVMDSGYKYQYDKYNDVYRWVPLNGDIAGLCARTDDVRDPWYSPAGLNRGQIKNVIKLSWNPRKGERDVLYANGINPVVNFPGDGIVMFGDKTLLAKPSAFDRINVRRLFIVLEKAISRASQYTLFEFNDEFTRSQFVNLVTPYLRTVKARRGITDFVVVCDETNNTGDVVDRNEFVGDIYIKPARSINFIQLNFVAVRSGVEFSEVIGNF